MFRRVRHRYSLNAGKSFREEILFPAVLSLPRADSSAPHEEASSVDSGTETHSGLFISNVIMVGCRIAPLIFRWRAPRGAPGRERERHRH